MRPNPPWTSGLRPYPPEFLRGPAGREGGAGGRAVPTVVELRCWRAAWMPDDDDDDEEVVGGCEVTGYAATHTHT